MDRGTWQATIYRVIESQTRLKQLSTHAPIKAQQTGPCVLPALPSHLLFNHRKRSLFQEIQSLLTNWKGPDLTSYGELVLEGTFRLQRAKNERTLFLFDKLLLITKKRDDTFTYKAHILVGLSGHPGWGLGALVLLPCEPASPSLLAPPVRQPHAGGSDPKGAPELQRLPLQEPQAAAHGSGTSVPLPPCEAHLVHDEHHMPDGLSTAFWPHCVCPTWSEVLGVAVSCER